MTEPTDLAAIRSELDEIDAGLVDRIVLFIGKVMVGEGGVVAPIGVDAVPAGFTLVGENRYGEDRMLEFERVA